ncbi:MAG: alpha-ketoacid dehydrogenase subunit beta [Rhodobacterales bacterium]|nr:alpha-ketoacid dehydrogenase subunit beta [Rhodobacterales bacterium]
MSALLTQAAAIRDVLHTAMSKDDDVLLLGETVGRAGGVAGTTAGLLEAFGADRVRDLPVAERGTLGMALGMALAGKTVVVELSGTGRLAACFEVLTEAANIAQQSEFAVRLIVRVPCGTQAGAHDRPVGQHIAAIPGLTVLCPSDANQAAGLLRSALSSHSPVVLLEPRKHYKARAEVNDNKALLTARTLREGSHITLAAWGSAVDAALVAADALAADGIRAEVLDLVAIRPLDVATLGASVCKTGRLVVVHPEDAALADLARNVGLNTSFLYLESPLATAPDEATKVAAAARESVYY